MAVLAPFRPAFPNGRSFVKLPSGVSLSAVACGRGRPVVLVPGLGRGADLWSRQIGPLARRFRAIAIENRGSGRSEKPPGPYSIEGMARDLAAFFDATATERADVVGASMGGFVALTLALDFPERVRRLVLLCTSAGGPRSFPMPEETWRALVSPPGRNAAERLLSAARLGFSDGYAAAHGREIARSVARRLSNLPPREAWLAQAAAGAAFDVSARLGEIRAPALVLAGAADRVLPCANSRLLAAGLPDARLVEFEDAGHYLMVERARDVNRLILSFLEEDSP